mmetsp:Transcript_4489/g.5560  ORF Transcript_4489/g.5560 Transcript_4489/m.5560 type:complete len:130 (-) Transcript_4489:387-776(-)
MASFIFAARTSLFESFIRVGIADSLHFIVRIPLARHCIVVAHAAFNYVVTLVRLPVQICLLHGLSRRTSVLQSLGLHAASASHIPLILIVVVVAEKLPGVTAALPRRIDSVVVVTPLQLLQVTQFLVLP